MKRLVATINPAMVTWARGIRGMPIEVAAKKSGISIKKLQAIENGEARPTLNQLRSIAKLYRKPTAFFYLEQTPALPPQMQDFRLLPDAENGPSPGLLDMIARARQRKEDAFALARLLNQEIPDFGVNARLNQSAIEISRQLRARIAITIDQQHEWQDHYTALNGWTDAIETSGVLVSHFSDVEVSEARGFSLSERPFPVIALNGKDAPRARIFTLFHELSHIALNDGGLCDLHEEGNHAEIEQFCNQIAAETLVPGDSILNLPLVSQHRGQIWEEEEIDEIANHYVVSKEVILRRLLTLNRTSNEFYRRKRREYTENLRRRPPQKGFMPYFRRVLRDNGPKFTTLALDAYYREAISSLDLSRVLGGVNLVHAPEIEQALADRGRR